MSKVALTLMGGIVNHSKINLHSQQGTQMLITQVVADLKARMEGEVEEAVIQATCNRGFNIYKIKMLKLLFQESFLVKV